MLFMKMFQNCITFTMRRETTQTCQTENDTYFETMNVFLSNLIFNLCQNLKFGYKKRVSIHCLNSTLGTLVDLLYIIKFNVLKLLKNDFSLWHNYEGKCYG